MDLLEGLQKIERRGEKLVLWVDAKRRHQLRAVANPRKQDGPQPSLDDWELSLRERRLVAKARRDEKARSPRRSSERTPPTRNGGNRHAPVLRGASTQIAASRSRKPTPGRPGTLCGPPGGRDFPRTRRGRRRRGAREVAVTSAPPLL